MPVARHGNRLAFWDGATTYNASTNPGGGVSVPGTGAVASAAVEIGRTGNSMAFYLRVLGSPAFITKWQVQASHSGGLDNATGEPVDQDAVGKVWYDSWYYGMVPTSEPYGTQGATNIQFWLPSGGGSVVNIVPDWVPGWVRLVRVDTGNAAVTVEAGFEVQSE